MTLFDLETGVPTERAARFVDENRPVGAGRESAIIESIAADGSNRSFARVRFGDFSAVLVYGPDPKENRSYEMIGRHLWDKGGYGPEFLAVDREAGFFLIEDLGSVSLQDYAAGAGDIYRSAMYEKVLGLMADLHHRGLTDFDPDWCHQTPRYDRNLILRLETGYFLSAFVQDWLGWEDWPETLPGEFEALATAALKGTRRVLMHRDFQSRNVMIKDGRPRLIDFQGARPGPPAYDLASLLYDPYAKLDEKERARFFEYYLDRRRSTGGFGEKAFRNNYPLLAGCRLLQALGAYGNLSKNKGKTWFEAYIPPAVASLHDLVGRPEFDFCPDLRRFMGKVRDAVGSLN